MRSWWWVFQEGFDLVFGGEGRDGATLEGGEGADRVGEAADGGEAGGVTQGAGVGRRPARRPAMKPSPAPVVSTAAT